MKFSCSQCGACCRNVTGLDLPQDKHGVCLNLDKKTNKCSIYDSRPEICRVNVMYKKYFKHKMSKKDFYILNTKACHNLIDKENLSDEFKVDINKYNENV
jgi:uncharacterized protein